MHSQKMSALSGRPPSRVKPVALYPVATLPVGGQSVELAEP